MRITDVRIMRGPNYWSTYRKNLVVMTLDLEELENYPTNMLDGFCDKLKKLMPTLEEHRCSEGKPGGFFERVRSGTWLGHVIEHVALELQTLAGMSCGFGRTRSTDIKAVYKVVFDYEVESAGIYAAYAAVNIISKLVSDFYCDITKDIKELTAINEREGLGPGTKSLVEEAYRRGIPYKRLDKGSMIRFGQGKNQKIVCATMACTTGAIGMEIAADKQQAREILEQGYVPVPEGQLVSTEEELLNAIKELNYPLVIKPVNGNHGRAVKVNLTTEKDCLLAFNNAKKISGDVLVERFIKGSDYRLLVVNYKLYAVARRTPASITGDDKSTIQELIDAVNNDPKRGNGHEKILTTIKVDAVTQSLLVEKKLTLNSVLPCGEILYLKDAANLSAGGTAQDVTGLIHPYNIFLAERVARLVGLDICGIDLIAADITAPLGDGNGAILEVNAAPGFRMHLSPGSGMTRNVAMPVMDMLFPNNAPSRIPIVAVTGTNGKTTTTNLVAHLARCAGHVVGSTTTDGIFIDGHCVYAGDCSGPSSAELILRDPIVDFAAFECARGGILRSGLGFDKCNVSIITNIAEDHLGLDGINDLKQLAKVKSVIAHSTFDEGFAVLNADDPLVFNIARDLHCQVALFSTSENNPRVQAHCDNGGWAAIVDEGFFTICKGSLRTRVGKLIDIPLTLGGRAECMIQNILPAILSMAIMGVEIETIREGLVDFIPGPINTPGRMNIYEFGDKTVMVDYAHNPDGFRRLATFMDALPNSPKIGIITCPGDRRDEDHINIGMLSAEIFDEIIVRYDHDLRGRTQGNIGSLIREGICKINPGIRLHEISDEREAIVFALKRAPKGAFIVACIDEVRATTAFMKDIMKKGLPVNDHPAKIFPINQEKDPGRSGSCRRG
jgi:cyanophycin synthetase